MKKVLKFKKEILKKDLQEIFKKTNISIEIIIKDISDNNISCVLIDHETHLPYKNSKGVQMEGNGFNLDEALDSLLSNINGEIISIDDSDSRVVFYLS